MQTETTHERSGGEFHETLMILWRRKLIVVATAAAVTLTALFMSASGEPVYEASSLVVIRPLVPAAAFQSSGYGGPLGLDVSTKDERQIAKSSSVVNRLREDMDLPMDAPVDVTVEIISEHMLKFIAWAPTAEAAAELSNEHARAYLGYRAETTERGLRDIVDRLKVRMDALVKDLAKIDKRVLNLSASVGSLGAIRKPSASVEARRAEQQQEIMQLSSIRNEKLIQLTSVRTRYEDAMASMGRSSGGGDIVEVAVPPLAPSSPKPFRALIIGLIFGLGLGVALAFMRSHFDTRIRSAADAARALGAPVLGLIPRSKAWRRRKVAHLDSIADPRSTTAEAYRTLRQSLIRAGVGRDLKTVLITSGGNRAGKSVLAANLGVQFARAGYRTIVLSGDLRHPRVHEFFELENETGLGQLLYGTEDVWHLPETGVKNLWLVPSGAPVDIPQDLLDGPIMRAFMEKVTTQADVILIDSPALSAGADAAILTQYADVTLLAMRMGSARVDGTAAAVRRLTQVGAGRIGAVLTVADAGRRSYRVEMIEGASLGAGPAPRGIAAPARNGHAIDVEIAMPAVTYSNGNGTTHAANGGATVVTNGNGRAAVAVAEENDEAGAHTAPRARRPRAPRAPKPVPTVEALSDAGPVDDEEPSQA